MASMIGLTSQIHEKNDALKRKNETILILNHKVGNRIINIEDYSKISSYVVINLIKLFKVNNSNMPKPSNILNQVNFRI